MDTIPFNWTQLFIQRNEYKSQIKRKCHEGRKKKTRKSQRWRDFFNPLTGAAAGILQMGDVNTMATDALAPCIARTSEATKSRKGITRFFFIPKRP